MPQRDGGALTAMVDVQVVDQAGGRGQPSTACAVLWCGSAPLAAVGDGADHVAPVGELGRMTTADLCGSWWAARLARVGSAGGRLT
jgi:hypothetical protein